MSEGVGWALSNANHPDWESQIDTNVQNNLALKKAQQGYSALSGVDFNDPTSIQNAVGNLVKSGNTDQASALAGLSLTQQIRNSPSFQSYLNGTPNQVPATAGAPPSAPGATDQPPPPADTPVPTDGNSRYAQAISAHAADTLNQASAAIQNIKALPPEQRANAIANLKDNFVQRGIDPAAFDQEANHILSAPDVPTQNARLDELASHYQAHADAHGAVAQGQQPTPDQQAAVAASPASPSTASAPNGQPWYVDRVNNPQFARDLQFAPLMKTAGIDMGPSLEAIRQLAQPYVDKNADLANARGIASETEAGKLPAEAALEQIKAHFENGYKALTLYAPGQTQGITVTNAEFGEHPDKYVGYSTSPESGAQAKATAFGGASASQVAVPIDLGNGRSKMITLAGQEADDYRHDGTVPSRFLENGANVGQTPPAVDTAATAGDYDNMNKYRSTLPQHEQDIATAKTKAQTQLDLLDSGKINPTNLTPQAKNVYDAFYSLGLPIDKDKVNNLSAYKQLVEGNILSRVHDFGGKFSQFDGQMLHQSLGGLTTPKDAATLSLALGVAEANRQQGLAESVRTQPQQLSYKSAQANYADSAKSLFADPVMQKYKYNGQPIVKAYPPQTDGHQWGVVLLGRNPKDIPDNKADWVLLK